MKNKFVLVLAHYFLPANNAGGPPKSLANLIDTIGEHIPFRVLCSDHEYEVPDKLDGVEFHVWTKFKGYTVFYQNERASSLLRIVWFCIKKSHPVIYLNSFFDPKYTIIPLLVSVLFRKKVLLSPRGEFSESALKIKANKKNIYLNFFKFFSLQRKIDWIATSEKELADIRLFFNENLKIQLLNNFPSPVLPQFELKAEKSSGVLKLVYLARIAPMKNTKFLFEVLAQVKNTVLLDIYGPVEHKDYWQECLELLGKMPSNVTVIYKGGVAADHVISVLRQYDAYILPTLGENFGHSIFEAASVGLPLIISDQTPWRNLEEKRIGYDLPLSRPDRFTAVIDGLADMDLDELNNIRKNVYCFAEHYVKNNKDVFKAKEIFSI